MESVRTLIAATFTAALFIASPFVVRDAHAQVATPDSLVYALDPSAGEFEWGCFAPCECPVLVQAPLTGTFLLRRASIGPLYTNYDVLDVRWKTTQNTQTVAITGSGTYRRGGEVENMEQLTLDLSFDGAPSQHFDSGLRQAGAAFPVIDTRLSLHDEYCHDSVLVVVAKPIGVEGVGGRPVGTSLAVAPNPFAASTVVQFALPRAGTANVSVFDLFGRRVRELLSGASLDAGVHELRWDGRLENGGPAPPALYVIRLDSPAGAIAHTVAKLR